MSKMQEHDIVLQRPFILLFHESSMQVSYDSSSLHFLHKDIHFKRFNRILQKLYSKDISNFGSKVEMKIINWIRISPDYP